MNEYRLRHTILLARPLKRNISKKYEHEVVKWKKFKHPIVPIKNKRLNMLTQIPKYKITPKYETQSEPSTCVSRAILEAVCAPRIDHLSRPFVRSLKAHKKEHLHYGKQFIDMMNERINMSYDTIYYHNVKSLMDIAAQKLKAKKVAPEKKKCWDECGDRERMEFLAVPKKPPPPRKLRKRKWKDLSELIERIEVMAVPRFIYKSPSKDSMIKQCKINPAALEYVATERILQLTKQPDYKLIPPWIPVAVRPSALEYIITKRVKQLAEPRIKSKVESDEKENPYDINPFALKYKATKRIVELSKPIER